MRLSETVIRGACVLFGYSLHRLVQRISTKPRTRTRSVHTSSAPVSNEPHKMVLVVNDELKMGKGKVGAQCAHAAVGLVEAVSLRWPHLLDAWENCGQAKICLRTESTAALEALGRKARKAGLATYIVRDAGRTQVAPGSKTVLAIGPATNSALDPITGSLRLLS